MELQTPRMEIQYQYMTANIFGFVYHHVRDEKLIEWSFLMIIHYFVMGDELFYCVLPDYDIIRNKYMISPCLIQIGEFYAAIVYNEDVPVYYMLHRIDHSKVSGENKIEYILVGNKNAIGRIKNKGP